MIRALSLAALVTLASSAIAQDGIVPVAATQVDASQKTLPGSFAGSERWIVTFKTRSFTLAALRAANRAGDAEAVAKIVADLETNAAADQAAFKREVEGLGGKIHEHYWIINGCAIDIAPAKLAAIRAMPIVDRMDADQMQHPIIKDATGSRNHNSDAVNAAGDTGKGVATAIMDTGLDSNMGGSGRPHRTFFENGDPTKRNRLVQNQQIGIALLDCRASGHVFDRPGYRHRQQNVGDTSG